jgi:thiol:disulfide interchange protein DsbG
MSSVLLHRLGVAAALSLLVVTTAANASRNYPKAIRDAIANGATVVKTFPAVSGLTGWVLVENGIYSVAYTTPDQRTLIVGNLFDQKGVNLTDRYAEKHFPKPDRSSAFSRLAQASYVMEGASEKPTRMIYVFADADGPEFQHLRALFQPYYARGLQVRWIPVASSAPASQARAIEMLETGRVDASGRKEGEDGGRLRSFLQNITDAKHTEFVNKVKRNRALMEALGISVLPAMTWSDRSGKVNVRSGLPESGDIKKMTGIETRESPNRP